MFAANQCSLGINMQAVRLTTKHNHRNTTRPQCGQFEQQLATPGKVWVAFGTDLVNLQYAANAPLSAYIWNRHLNISPIVFVVGNISSTPSKILTGAIKDAGAKVELIQPVQNHSTSTLAQVVRIAAYSLPYVSPNDYIITTDADIWPMSTVYWSKIFNYSAHFTIVNGEFFRGGLGGEIGIAMCYVGARANSWRALVEGSNGSFPIGVKALDQLACDEDRVQQPTPLQIAAAILDAGKEVKKERWNNLAKGAEQWYWDQIFMTYAFRHAVKKYNATYHLGAGLGSRRLDRSGWRFGGEIERHTDAHLIFPLSSDSVRQNLMAVWKAMFNDTSWPEAFLSEYFKV